MQQTLSAKRLAAAGARGGLVTIVAQLATMLVQMIGLIVLARLLTPSDYGVAAVAGALCALVVSVVLMGLPMAMVQAEHANKSTLSALMIVVVGIGLLASFLLVGVSPVVGELYDNSQISDALLLLSALPLISAFQCVFRVVLIRQLRFVALCMSDVVSATVGLAAGVATAVAVGGYLAVVASMVCQALAQTAIVIAVAGWLPCKPAGWSGEVFRIVKTGLSVFGMGASREIGRGLLVPIIGLNASASQVGAFDRAYQLGVAQPSLAADQLQRVAIPVLARVRNDPVVLDSFARRLHLLVFTAALVPMVWLTFQGDLAVRLVLGQHWDLAGEILQLLAAGTLFRISTQVMQWLAIGSGKAQSGLRASLYVQPFVLVLTACGLPWGVAAASIAHTVAWVIAFPIYVLMCCSAAGVEARPIFQDSLSALCGVGIPLVASQFLVNVFVSSPVERILVSALICLTVSVIASVIIPRVRRTILIAVRLTRSTAQSSGGVE